MSITFQITKKVRNAFIVNLRNLFVGDPKYPYVETIDGEYDFDNSKIFISDEIPQEHANFPAIVIDAVSGQEQRYLGPDTYRHSKDNNAVTVSDELFASVPLTVTAKIYTIGDTRARDEIMDRVFDQFKLLPDHLASEGIEIARQSFQPDSKTFSGDQWWLTGTMSFEIYTEWSDDLGVDDVVGSLPITLSLIP